MTGNEHEASKLGVDPEWLAARSQTVGIARCPTCWPGLDIIKNGDYIAPCPAHDGNSAALGAPDDVRVTAPLVEIAVSGGFV